MSGRHNQVLIEYFFLRPEKLEQVWCYIIIFDRNFILSSCRHLVFLDSNIELSFLELRKILNTLECGLHFPL